MPRLSPLVLVLLAALGAGCDGLPDEETGGDLYERLERKRDFQALAGALTDVGEDALLRSERPLTVLAPTDIAFEYVGGDFLAILTEPDNAGVLARLLRHHVVEGRLSPDDFVDGDTLRSVDGLPLPVRRIGPVVRVGSATLDFTRPVEAGDAVAYPVADVLLGALSTRERVNLSPSLSRFRDYARQADLLDRAEALGSATVLAPIDDAFVNLGGVTDRLFALASNADVAQRALAFHLVPGVPELVDGRTVTSAGGDPLAVRVEGGVRMIGGRRVLREEVTANGRLLVLGGLVLDPLSLAQRLRIEPSTTLFAQDVRTRLPDVWARFEDGGDALTVFAPTNFAYGFRGDAVNAALAEPIHAALNERLLKVHIVEGRLTPDDLTDGRELVTLEGAALGIIREDRAVYFDGRVVSTGARMASNGVVYRMGGFATPFLNVLDTALLRGYTKHVAAIRRAGLAESFLLPGATMFVASDSLHNVAGGRLWANPGPFLLYNATTTSIPGFDAMTFTALDGAERRIRRESCPPPTGIPGPDPEPAPLCRPFRLEDGTYLDQRSGASDGSGYFHEILGLSYPPGY